MDYLLPLISLGVCLVCVAVIGVLGFKFYKGDFDSALGINNTTAPVAPAAPTEPVVAEEDAGGKTSKGKTSSSSSSSLPIDKSVVILKASTCKGKKSVLTARGNATNAQDNEVGLWCRIENNNSLWKISRVSGSRKYYRIKNSGTGQYLSGVWQTPYVVLKGSATDSKGRLGQQWEIKRSDYGFYLINRLFKDSKMKHYYLDAKGCETSGTFDGQSTFYWDRATANQRWYIKAATTSSDLSGFASMTMC